MDSDVFSSEPFSERTAWVWLIEQAAWKQTTARIKGTTLALDRGEATFSVRFMAEKWQWSKSRVDRFLKRLCAENMISIRSKIGTDLEHSAGQGQSIITICNYDKYQSSNDESRDNSGTTAGQQRDNSGTKKKEVKKERKEESYAFSGAVIRLSQEHYDSWLRSYSAIPDLMAELQALDDWLSTEPDSVKAKWFFRVSGALKNKNREYIEAQKRSSANGYGPDHSGIPL